MLEKNLELFWSLKHLKNTGPRAGAIHTQLRLKV